MKIPATERFKRDAEGGSERGRALERSWSRQVWELMGSRAFRDRQGAAVDGVDRSFAIGSGGRRRGRGGPFTLTVPLRQASKGSKQALRASSPGVEGVKTGTPCLLARGRGGQNRHMLPLPTPFTPPSGYSVGVFLAPSHLGARRAGVSRAPHPDAPASCPSDALSHRLPGTPGQARRTTSMY